MQSKTRVRQRERSDTPPTFFYIDGEDETGLPRPDDFVVGSENRTAAVACELFLETAARRREEDSPAATIPPLYVYGPEGSGKSCLVRTLTAGWRALFPDVPFVVQTAVDYRRALARAIDRDQGNLLRARITALGLFVLEDIEHLAGYPAAIDEFLQVFEAAVESQTAIACTSQFAPWELPGFPRALTARLEGGYTAPVAFPGPVARRLFLRLTADKLGCRITGAALDYLAESLEGSAGAMTARFGELLAAVRPEGATRRPLDVADVRKWIERRRASQRPDLPLIARLAARAFRRSVKELRSADRRQVVVLPRNVAMYVAHAHFGYTLKEIGKYFGNRDHKTVSHGCHKIEQLQKTDKILQREIERLLRELRVEDALCG
ncbi:hypothetical protein JCM19992_02090 [Thermostilla marina]